MLTYFLGKPNAFLETGGTATNLAELQGVSAGDINDPFIGGSDGYYPNSGNILLTSFISFWAKPNESTYSTNYVFWHGEATSSTQNEYFCELGKNGIRIVHDTGERRGGVFFSTRNVDYTHTANLSGYNHYMFYYRLGTQEHDFKLYINGIEITTGTDSSDADKGDGLSINTRTVGGREKTFYSGTSGGANYIFQRGWAGSISGYYEEPNAIYHSNNTSVTITQLVDRHYSDYYDSSGNWIGTTPGASIPGLAVDYTGVSVPSFTRPT